MIKSKTQKFFNDILESSGYLSLWAGKHKINIFEGVLLTVSILIPILHFYRQGIVIKLITTLLL